MLKTSKNDKSRNGKNDENRFSTCCHGILFSARGSKFALSLKWG